MNRLSLTLDRVLCERGGKPLFQPVSLSLGGGQWLQVQGHNGAGKTTLLRTICGLSPMASGQILWNSQSLNQQAASFEGQLLYMGHALALKAELSALENLLVDARMRGHNPDQVQALQALADMGLQHRAHLPLRVLSQGQQRRAALARLALSRAALWVLDEPWVALDTDSAALLTRQLDAHVQAGGLLLFTSHQPVTLSTAGAVLRLLA